MKTEFDVKITTMDMYRFLMHHAYSGPQGIFSILAGAALIVYYFIQGKTLTNSWIYVAFGALFLLYFPFTLYQQAIRQVKLGTAFKESLHYTVSEKEILVQQGKQSVELQWKDILKVKETGSNLLIYTGKQNAFIWPKRLLKDEQTLRQIIQKCVPEKQHLKKMK